MRILVLGAGGIGGYFGGRLVEKGEDVVFLVREKRKKQLEENGLKIKSVNGDYSFTPKLITKEDRAEPFDIVLLSPKAYHLKGAIHDLRPFVGEKTVIIPLLNGISHLEILKESFNESQILGGLCIIETTLNASGEVVQTSPFDQLVFGELNHEKTDRIKKIGDTFAGTKADFRLSEQILQDMWHKYLRITVLSSITTLTRAPIGPIRESAGSKEFISRLYQEVTQIMRAYNAPIADNIEEEQLESISNLKFNFKTSMQRDMEKGSMIEGEHIQGYLMELANELNIETPYLDVIYQNLKVYIKMLSTPSE